MPFSAMAESHIRLPRASKSSMFWSSRRMFTTVFFSWIIPRVHSALEALQTVGYLLLPVAVFLLLQLTGVLRWNAGLMLLAAVVLIAGDVAFYNRSGRRFQAEALLGHPENRPGDS